jgi:hypothetical protein
MKMAAMNRETHVHRRDSHDHGKGRWLKEAARPLGFALLVLVGLGTVTLRAQPFRVPTVLPASQSPQAKQAFQAKVDEAARVLAREPRLKQVPREQRQALVEFLVGKALFVAAHEMGLALISEMALPVLGRREALADQFAVLTVLKHGEQDFSDRVLVEAGKGWFMAAPSNRTDAGAPTHYDQHGLAEKRGHQIVCLMVGADPDRFKALADETKLPHERRRTCGWEYDTASRKWEKALAPYRRAADQPKQKIDVIYEDAKGRLDVYAQVFRGLRFLETVAELAADRFTWRAPIVMKMQSCRAVGARWTIATRTLHICYEMAQEFAELYRDYGRDRTPSRR